MNVRKEVLYDVGWQTIRISLLGNFVINIDSNIDTLLGYLKSDSKDYLERLWRVLNLLNATRMGFYGMNRVGGAQDLKLIAFRVVVSSAYKEEFGKRGFHQHSWDKVRIDLKYLHILDIDMFNALYKDLTKRVKQGIKKNKGSLVKVKDNRKELFYFLAIMDDIAND